MLSVLGMLQGYHLYWPYILGTAPGGRVCGVSVAKKPCSEGWDTESSARGFGEGLEFSCAIKITQDPSLSCSLMAVSPESAHALGQQERTAARMLLLGQPLGRRHRLCEGTMEKDDSSNL